jgi:hypothetical protein
VSPVDAEDLQRSLRRAAHLFDPVTDGLLEAAVLAHTVRMPGAELAEVTFDSRTAPVPVRGGTRVRLLTFDAATLSVDVEVTPRGSDLVLVGQLTPGRPAEITVRGRRPAVTVADRLGRFGLPHLARGPFSLLVRAHGAGPLITDWIGPCAVGSSRVPPARPVLTVPSSRGFCGVRRRSRRPVRGSGAPG